MREFNVSYDELSEIEQLEQFEHDYKEVLSSLNLFYRLKTKNIKDKKLLEKFYKKINNVESIFLIDN